MTLPYPIRRAAGRALAPILRFTGYRFSKDFRHGATLAHRVVYALVDTVGANHAAGLQFDGGVFRAK